MMTKMPWWGVVLIAIACLVIGGGVAYLVTMIYIGKGMWQ